MTHSFSLCLFTVSSVRLPRDDVTTKGETQNSGLRIGHEGLQLMAMYVRTRELCG